MIMNPLMLDYVCRWIYGRNVFSLGFETFGPFQLGRPYQEDELYRLLHILNTDRFFVGQNIYRTI